MNLTQTLQLIAIGIAALKGVPQIDPKILGFIQIADDAINAALTASQGVTAVEPEKLGQIEPV